MFFGFLFFSILLDVILSLYKQLQKTFKILLSQKYGVCFDAVGQLANMTSISKHMPTSRDFFYSKMTSSLRF